MTLTRRRAVQLSLIAAFLPSFLSTALAGDRTAGLYEGWRRAVSRGRPLLALVAPADEADNWIRGEAFGALLNEGGDDALSVLALCEVVVADRRDLEDLLGQPVPSDAWYVLAETASVPAVVRFATGPTPAPELQYDGDWNAREDAKIEGLIRAHREMLHRVVLPDRAALVRYAAQATAVDPASAEQVRGSITRTAAPDAALGPAIVALAAVDGGIDRQVAAQILAEVARTEWVAKVIPGSRWARAGGCGLTIEGGDNNSAFGCGMGYVSPKARRMLYFYREERPL